MFSIFFVLDYIVKVWLIRYACQAAKAQLVGKWDSFELSFVVEFRTINYRNKQFTPTKMALRQKWRRVL